MYALSEVSEAGARGRVLWGVNGTDRGQQAQELSPVGWRTVLIMAFGCRAAPPAVLTCAWTKFSESEAGPGITDSNRVLPTSHAGEVWALDLTPVLENAPRAARLGIDRLDLSERFEYHRRKAAEAHTPPSAWSNTAETSSVVPWSWYHAAVGDIGLIRNISETAAAVCWDHDQPGERPAPRWAQDTFLSQPPHEPYQEAIFRNPETRNRQRNDFNVSWNADIPPNTSYGMCSIKPLRWKRLAAAGLHVNTLGPGLRIMLPPGDTKWSAQFSPSTGVPLSSKPPSCASAVSLDSPHSFEQGLSAAAETLESLLPTLIVTPNNDLANGIESPSMQPSGRNGPLSEIGAPTIMVFRGRRSLVLNSRHQLLEVFATVPTPGSGPMDSGVVSPCNELTAWNQTGLETAADPFDLEGSRHLTHGLTFWGAWRGPDQEVGGSPNLLFSGTQVDIPVSDHALNSSNLFPSHPGGMEEFEWMEFSSVDEIIDKSLESWEWTVRERRWGPRAAGYDLAFLSPHNTPLSIADSARVFRSIASVRRSNQERWLVIIGGCTSNLQELWQVALCMDWSTIPNAGSFPITTILADKSTVNTVQVFDPAIMTWLSKDVHRIPDLPAPLYLAGAFRLDHLGIVVIGGGSFEASFGSTDGDVVPFVSNRILFFQWAKPAAEWQEITFTLRSVMTLNEAGNYVIAKPATDSLIRRGGFSVQYSACPSFILKHQSSSKPFLGCSWALGGQFVGTSSNLFQPGQTSFSFARDMCLQTITDIGIVAFYMKDWESDAIGAEVWGIQGGEIGNCSNPYSGDNDRDVTTLPKRPLKGEELRGCFSTLQSVTVVNDQIYVLGGGSVSTTEPEAGSQEERTWTFSQLPRFCRIDVKTGLIYAIQSGKVADNVDTERITSTMGGVLQPYGEHLMLVGGVDGTSTMKVHGFDIKNSIWVTLNSISEPISVLDEAPFNYAPFNTWNISQFLPTTRAAGFRFNQFGDLSRSAAQAPFDRALSHFISVGNRLYILEGFSTQKSSIQRNLLVLISDRNTLRVKQNMPEVIQRMLSIAERAIKHHATQSDDHRLAIEYIFQTDVLSNCLEACAAGVTENAVNLILDAAITQDGLCQIYEEASCGTIEQAVSILEFNDQAAGVRSEIVIESSIFVSNIRITSPIVVRAVGELKAWIFCRPLEATIESCIEISTEKGTSPPVVDQVVLSSLTAVSWPKLLSLLPGATSGENLLPFQPIVSPRFIYCTSSAITIQLFKSLWFGQNSEPEKLSPQGGCIMTEKCGITFRQSELLECHALEGGALGSIGGFVQAFGSRFIGNKALLRGAAALLICADGMFEGTLIQQNAIDADAATGFDEVFKTSSQFGGSGIFCSGEQDLIIRHSFLQGNLGMSSSTELAGGGIRTVYCSLTLYHTIIKDNHLTGKGGGIFLSASRMSVESSVLFNNSASLGGGGVYCSHCIGVQFQNTSVARNSAGGKRSVTELSAGIHGGGIYLLQPQAVLLYSTSVDGNLAEGHGGGMYLVSSAEGRQPEPLALVCFQQDLQSTPVSPAQILQSQCDLVYPNASSTLITSFFTSLTHNQAGLGGGGIYLNGYSVPTSLSAWGLTLSQNDAVYGPQTATGSRKLVLIGGFRGEEFVSWLPFTPSSPPTFVSRPHSPLVISPVVALIDGFAQVVSVDSTTVVSAIAQLLPCVEPPCLVSLRGGLITVDGGIGVFSALIPEVPPSTTVRFHFLLGNVDTRSIDEEAMPILFDDSITNPVEVFIDDCDAGFEFIPGFGCRECEPGFYSYEDVCVACPAGTTSSEGASDCEWCFPGTFAAEASGSCTPCPDGQYSGLGWGSCGVCPAGVSCQARQIALSPGTWIDRSSISAGEAKSSDLDVTRLPSTVLLAKAYSIFRDLPIQDMACFPKTVVALATNLADNLTVSEGQSPSSAWKAPSLACEKAAQLVWGSDEVVWTTPPNTVSFGGRTVKDSMIATSGAAFAWWLLCSEERLSEYTALLKTPLWVYRDLIHADFTSLITSADVVPVTPSTSIVSCPLPSACVLEADGHGTTCIEGHMGVACSVCEPKWASSGITVACTRCWENKGAHVALAVFTGLGFVLGVAVYIWLKMKGHYPVNQMYNRGPRPKLPQRLAWGSGAVSSSPRGTKLRCMPRSRSWKTAFHAVVAIRDGLLRVLLNAVQTNTILVEILRVSLGPGTFFIDFSLFNAVSIQCLTQWSFLERLISFLLLPVCSLLVLALCLAVLYLCKLPGCGNGQKKKRHGELTNEDILRLDNSFLPSPSPSHKEQSHESITMQPFTPATVPNLSLPAFLSEAHLPNDEHKALSIALGPVMKEAS